MGNLTSSRLPFTAAGNASGGGGGGGGAAAARRTSMGEKGC